MRFGAAASLDGHEVVVGLQRHRHGNIIDNVGDGRRSSGVARRCLAIGRNSNAADDILASHLVADGFAGQDISIPLVCYIVLCAGSTILHSYDVVVRHQLQRYRDVGRNLVQRNAVRGVGRSSSTHRDRAVPDEIPCTIAEQFFHRLSEHAHRRIDLRRIDGDARYTCHVPCHRAELRLIHRVERDRLAGLRSQCADRDLQRRSITNGKVSRCRPLRLCKAEELIASFLENGAVDGRVLLQQVDCLRKQTFIAGGTIIPNKFHRGRLSPPAIHIADGRTGAHRTRLGVGPVRIVQLCRIADNVMASHRRLNLCILIGCGSFGCGTFLHELTCTRGGADIRTAFCCVNITGCSHRTVDIYLCIFEIRCSAWFTVFIII